MPTLRSHAKKALSLTLAVALVLPAPMHAANLALSAVADVNTLDYVVNVDWDFDNPPTQVNNPSQVLDKAFITAVIRQAAQSKFTMTEGRHRMGTVYVYRNKQFGANVDIQLINTDDRSKANVAGWRNSGTSSWNHLSMSGVAESAQSIGKVVAHELGHYTYALFDEYVEEGKPLNPQQPSAPSQSDNAKTTMMNNHLAFTRLSTPADYTDTTQRQTAQNRIYGTGPQLTGGSAWEALVRPNDQAPQTVRDWGRTFFEAFRDVNPATLQITNPVAGFDAKLNIIFVSNPVFRDVFVVDRTLPAERLAPLVQAAKTMVQQSTRNTQYAIVVSPPVGDNALLQGFTDATSGSASLLAALDSIQPNTAGTFDALAAMTRAFQTLAAARQPGDPSTFHLLTGAEANVPVESSNTAVTARVAVNAVALTGGAEQRSQRIAQAKSQSKAGASVNLAELAKRTGGVYKAANSAAEASKDAVRVLKESHSVVYSAILIDEADKLPANGRYSKSFSLANGTTDGNVFVELYFDPVDAGALAFSLVSPSGTVYTPSNLPAGITYENDPGEGVAEFALSSALAGRAGQWTVRVDARAATRDGIGLEVSSDSRFGLSAAVEGGVVGNANTGVVIRALLGTDKRVQGAVVTADIYSEDGQLVMGGVTLRDDGQAPDNAAGDGQYFAALTGRLNAGEYFAIVHAQTNSGSRIAALGNYVKGAREPEVAVDAFTRVADVAFSLQAGAPGVIGTTTPPTPTTPTTPTPTTPGNQTPTAAASDDSGGCTPSTNGRDASLLLLLGAALLGWALRRRQPDAARGG